jgi:hypothetical protein
MGRHAKQAPITREFLEARTDRFLWEIAEETGLSGHYINALFKRYNLTRNTKRSGRDAVNYILRHRYMTGADLARRLSIRVPELRRMFEALGLPYRAREAAEGTPAPLISRECRTCSQRTVCCARAAVGARLICEGVMHDEGDEAYWKHVSSRLEALYPAAPGKHRRAATT